MYSERMEDIERLRTMSLEMLLVQKQYAIQEWWKELIEAEIKLRKAKAANQQ